MSPILPFNLRTYSLYEVLVLIVNSYFINLIINIDQITYHYAELKPFIWQFNQDYVSFSIQDVTPIRGFFLIYYDENARHRIVFHECQPLTEIFKVIGDSKVYYREINEISLLAMYNNLINDMGEECLNTQNLIKHILDPPISLAQQKPDNQQDNIVSEINHIPIQKLHWNGPISIQNHLNMTLGSILNTKEYLQVQLYEDHTQYIFHSEQLITDLHNINKKKFLYRALNERQLLEVFEELIENTCQDSTHRINMLQNTLKNKYYNTAVKRNQENQQFFNSDMVQSRISVSLHSQLFSSYSMCFQCELQIRGQIITTTCDHSYHLPCLEKILEIQLNLRKSVLICNCGQRLLLNDLTFIDEQTSAKLKDHLHKNQLSTIQEKNQQQISKCSNPNCCYIFMNTDDSNPFAQCQMCGI